MSTLPYFAWQRVAHSSVWIADSDEIMYTEVASHAYRWHPMYLSDPTFVGGGQSVYSWLQLVPGEIVCKILRLRPIRFGLVLRIIGGLAIGFGWYALMGQSVRRPGIALVGAVFLLTDCGWLVTRPFVHQWATLASVLFDHPGELFAHQPSIHASGESFPRWLFYLFCSSIYMRFGAAWRTFRARELFVPDWLSGCCFFLTFIFGRRRGWRCFLESLSIERGGKLTSTRDGLAAWWEARSWRGCG